MSQLMSQLVCPECRHENEAERVYCHNCGAKLNRTAPADGSWKNRRRGNGCDQGKIAPHDGSARGQSAPVNLQHRETDSRSGSCRRLDSNVPCARFAGDGRKDLELGPQIGLDLEHALLQHRGTQLTYQQDQVNSYLANVLKRKKTSLLDKPLLEFRRGVAQFDEGAFRMTAERSIFGCSLYTSAFYRVNVQNGKAAGMCEGGMIGRMPIHPQLMRYANFLLSDVWKALEQDEKQVAKFAAIEFHPKTVVLTAPAQ